MEEEEAPEVARKGRYGGWEKDVEEWELPFLGRVRRLEEVHTQLQACIGWEMKEGNTEWSRSERA